MSIRALLSGTETYLRGATVLNDIPAETVGKVCGVQPDGSPPAGAGQWYYAIYFSGVRNMDPNSLSADWAYSLTVAITKRMGEVPRDRRAAKMVATQELLDQAIYIASVLHQNDDARIIWNSLITGEGVTVNGFLTPLKMQSISEVERCPASWLYTQDSTEAYYVLVKFGDAQRIQLLPAAR